MAKPPHEKELDRVRALAQAASSTPSAYEFTDFQTQLVVAITKLQAAAMPATTAAILSVIHGDTGLLHNPPQTHTALDRMVTLGFLAAHETTPPPGTKGRPPKAYSVTNAGKETLNLKRAATERLLQSIQSAEELATAAKTVRPRP